MTRHLTYAVKQLSRLHCTWPSESAPIRQQKYSNVTVQGPCDPIKKNLPSLISIKITPKYAEWADFIAVRPQILALVARNVLVSRPAPA